MLLTQDVELERFARDNGVAFIVLFGSQAKGRPRAGSDVDIAVMPLEEDLPADTLNVLDSRLFHALYLSLGRGDIDLVWLHRCDWLLWWQVARDGKVMFETERGQFAHFRQLATMRYMDSAVWTVRQREYIRRYLEGNTALDTALVREELSLLSEYTRHTEEILASGRDHYLEKPLVQFAAAKLIELLVESATSINTEVAQALKAIPPSDYYSSFFSMAQAGWIDRELAGALAELAKIRNRLVHQYARVAMAELYDTLNASVPLWRRYVRSVQERLDAAGP